MSERPVRAAVVGAGTVSNVHLRALEDHPRTDLVAICDTDEERADTAARTHGIAAAYDVDDLMDRDLDLVHVCTPVQTHLPVARTAIESGAAVLIEKPVTETVAEVDELAAVAEENDVPASVVHQHLFSPVLREARRRVRSGEIGELRGVDLLYLGLTSPDEVKRGSWVFDLAGGEFEEGLPHPIYVTLGLGGYPQSESAIQAVTSLVGEYDAPFSYDNAQVQFATATGALSSIKMSSRGNPQRLIHVHGDEQSLLIDQLTQSIVVNRRDYTAGSPAAKARKNLDATYDLLRGLVDNGRLLARRSLNDDWSSKAEVDPHFSQIDGMVRAVEQGTEPPVPLAEARWTQVVMQAIREASPERAVERAPAR